MEDPVLQHAESDPVSALEKVIKDVFLEVWKTSFNLDAVLIDITNPSIVSEDFEGLLNFYVMFEASLVKDGHDEIGERFLGILQHLTLYVSDYSAVLALNGEVKFYEIDYTSSSAAGSLSVVDSEPTEDIEGLKLAVKFSLECTDRTAVDTSYQIYRFVQRSSLFMRLTHWEIKIEIDGLHADQSFESVENTEVQGFGWLGVPDHNYKDHCEGRPTCLASRPVSTAGGSSVDVAATLYPVCMQETEEPDHHSCLLVYILGSDHLPVLSFNTVAPSLIVGEEKHYPGGVTFVQKKSCDARGFPPADFNYALKFSSETNTSFISIVLCVLKSSPDQQEALKELQRNEEGKLLQVLEPGLLESAAASVLEFHSKLLHAAQRQQVIQRSIADIVSATASVLKHSANPDFHKQCRALLTANSTVTLQRQLGRQLREIASCSGSEDDDIIEDSGFMTVDSARSPDHEQDEGDRFFSSLEPDVELCHVPSPGPSSRAASEEEQEATSSGSEEETTRRTDSQHFMSLADEEPGDLGFQEPEAPACDQAEAAEDSHPQAATDGDLDDEDFSNLMHEVEDWDD